VASIALLLSVSGCGGATSNDGSGSGTATEGAGTIVMDAKDNASIAACSTNRALLAQQYAMAQSSEAGSVEFATVLQQSGAKCPSGGVYTWDEATGKARCSVHGE
jgi:hypothetical protein